MELQLDLTGKPARFDGALRGKVLSWQAFAKLTATPDRPADRRIMVEIAPHRCVINTVAVVLGMAPRIGPPEAVYVIDESPRTGKRPIPTDAVLRRKQPHHRPEPRPELQYWLGRKCQFARRYTDPTRHWRGWKPKPPETATRPLLAILAPLSATARARHYIEQTDVLAAIPQVPVQRRLPISEEHLSGRLSARHINAADWFATDMHATATAKVDGVRKRNSAGGMVAFGSRDPLVLWPAEAAADRAIRLRSRFRTMGPLAKIVVRALNGAEMSELAPAWRFPLRNVAEAGRIRLRAGLELCARMAEREVDGLQQWEILEVVQAACLECFKLEATRRMRVLNPANDNRRQRIAA
ncbi:MAG: hypothetical protein E5W91_32670 [Mesorhizobium sp.]|uniref:hypothetical protein n=1 Tax=Mesorhizobium sp. TaxID=1871066 RepID=UPI001202758E|nr:hypothetical protein [Mesorhizobium sp.]TIS53030.1 MAG: hypothetical protein E5W91_32670 [Mesorhizobium sp.]